MSQFGQAQEAGEGTPRKLYTGVENFKVVGVCPTQEELKAIFGDNAREDKYLYTAEIKDAEGNVLRTVPQIKIVMHLDNKDESLPIKTKVTYFVTKEYQMKTDGTKAQYINVYGRTAWLTPEDATNPPAIITMTGAKGAYHFDTTGMRKAYKGEEDLIKMLRNLLNLGSPEKAKDKSLVTSQFSEADWNTMFVGNVKALSGVALSSPNKIGILLGVQTAEENRYQNAYGRYTLPQYAKGGSKFDYIRKHVQNTQSNSGYSDTDFGDPSFKLAEYLADATPSDVPASPRGFGGDTPVPAFNAEVGDAFKAQ